MRNQRTLWTVFIGLCLLYLGFIIFACNSFAQKDEIPAPFGKAIVMALKAPSVEPGRYIWQATINKNGVETIYTIVYWENHIYFPDQIVLIKREESMRAITYHIDMREFETRMAVYTPESRWKGVDDQTGFRIAFEFFNDLVKDGLSD